jgi:hypothetical protein
MSFVEFLTHSEYEKSDLRLSRRAVFIAITCALGTQ